MLLTFPKIIMIFILNNLSFRQPCFLSWSFFYFWSLIFSLSLCLFLFSVKRCSRGLGILWFAFDMPEDTHSVSVVKLEVNAHSPLGYKSRILMDSLEWEWILFSSTNLWCLLSKLNHCFLWSAHAHTKGWGGESASMWKFNIRPMLKLTQLHGRSGKITLKFQ